MAAVSTNSTVNVTMKVAIPKVKNADNAYKAPFGIADADVAAVVGLGELKIALGFSDENWTTS
jgi:phage antirepressor YoqD-like protein